MLIDCKVSQEREGLDWTFKDPFTWSPSEAERRALNARFFPLEWSPYHRDMMPLHELRQLYIKCGEDPDYCGA